MRATRQWPLVVLGLCAVIFWLRADGVLSGSSAALLAAMVGLIIVVVGVTAIAALDRTPAWKWVVASPLAMAALTWLTLFALRPVELYLYPGETIVALLKLGYDTGDLSRTVAIGGVGCATWSIGFLIALALLRIRERKIPEVETLQLRKRVPWVMMAIGLALTTLIFMRQGGITALVDSPGSLHTNQGSGFYGQVGVWMLIGVSINALAVVLQRQGEVAARAKRLLIVSAPLAMISTLGIGSRGLVVFGLLAAGIVYLRFRTPGLRVIAATAVAAIVVAALFEFVGVVRTHGSTADLPTAVERTIDTPVTYFQTGDLSTFDDFVAIQQLVPSSISRLQGESLIDIPAALAPRAIWPGKPQPLDNLVTDYLEPGATSGSPITLQGELYWNFGVPAVAIGAFAVGILMAWSMLLLFRREPLGLMAYAVLYPSVFAFLTRALGTMTANTFLALVGVCAVTLAMNPTSFGLSIPRLRSLGTRV